MCQVVNTRFSHSLNIVTLGHLLTLTLLLLRHNELQLKKSTWVAGSTIYINADR